MWQNTNTDIGRAVQAVVAVQVRVVGQGEGWDVFLQGSLHV